ncbi:hypothetical protein MZE58_02435, partial [Escherichia coli]|nr:hypothetical protein [Escherichia coli]MCK2677170.1 hypothetical protein [Escherichia coli]MCK2690547.1 hypothetical protein [Escherichia coli]
WKPPAHSPEENMVRQKCSGIRRSYLVIINKGNEEVEGTWPNKLQPGIYKNMGSNSVNIIINNTRKIIPPGKVFTLRGGTLNINIPGRSALLLGKTGEPPNYLYL